MSIFISHSIRAGAYQKCVSCTREQGWHLVVGWKGAPVLFPLLLQLLGSSNLAVIQNSPCQVLPVRVSETCQQLLLARNPQLPEP